MARLLIFVLSSFCVDGLARAQSIVPDLEQQGRSGDIARAVYERAVKQFDQADSNSDGKLARKELATVSAFKANKFEQYDKDQDGFLNWQEFVGHDRWKK